LAQAITLDEFATYLTDETWPDHLFATDEALLGWRAAILGAENGARLRNGRQIVFDRALSQASALHAEGELLRAYSADGHFLGILRWDSAHQAWQPHKTLAIVGFTDE
jgi:hypothetical protein